MRLKTRIFRLGNRLLGVAGLRIAPIARDFDARLLPERDQRRITDQLCHQLNDWFAGQRVFVTEELLTSDEAYEFYRAYLASPFRKVFGGSRFNNLLSLHAVAKLFAPDVIIDSGTFEGASAWAMALGAPEAKVLSFDIDMSNLTLRHPRVEYVTADWTTYERTSFSGRRVLAYFDDHIDQARRLIEAQQCGIELAVFDDDFPVTSFAMMAHGGAALPKVEFVLDDQLRRVNELEWSDNDRVFRWTIDHAYLDRARAAIAATDRLPNTSLVTGIHQTPYRMVRISSA